MTTPPRFDDRTPAELLADAIGYERVAKALEGNDALAANLRALAAEARAKAAEF